MGKEIKIDMCLTGNPDSMITVSPFVLIEELELKTFQMKFGAMLLLHEIIKKMEGANGLSLQNKRAIGDRDTGSSMGSDKEQEAVSGYDLF